MRLLTKDIESAFEKHPLYSQEGSGKNSEVLASYRVPGGPGRWIITEAERQPNGDYLLFGLCEISEPEYGFVMLSELESIDLPMRIRTKDGIKEVPHAIRVESDAISPGKRTVKEVYEMYGEAYPFDFNAKTRDSTDRPSRGRIGGLLHGHFRK